ncbi:hypothetical protein AB0K09_05845 [Streptomyces sp. NPDC049577]|uniref:hypothetical protein n=1 Tax=Streptomyces sp. NPDC049577 TaxID=3155153 RepID=UPI003447D3C2
MNDRLDGLLVAGFQDALAGMQDLVKSVPVREAYDMGYQAAHAALAPIAWAKAIGDRLDTTQTQDLLGVSRQALAKRVASGSLLRLPGKTTSYYPRWQFDTAAQEVRPLVQRILKIFAEHGERDPYMIATWMMTPNGDLSQAKPAEWLENGKEEDPLLRAVHAVAERWGGPNDSSSPEEPGRTCEDQESLSTACHLA